MPNLLIVSKMLCQSQFFRNLKRKIGHEIFFKIEKTEYLSNQLTYALFDWKFIFPIKNWTFEQFLIFWISKIFQISGSTTTVKKRRLMVIKNSFLTRVPFYLSLHFILYFTAFLCVLHDISLPSI